MINKELFNAAFAELDGKYIERAATPPKKRNLMWIRITAASLTLLLAAFPVIYFLTDSYSYRNSN